MRILDLVVLTSLVSVAACSSGPTKEESLQIFAAATTAMASAQSRAVVDAQTPLQAPVELVLDFNGPCTLGGTGACAPGGRLRLPVRSDASGAGERTSVDLTTAFASFKEAAGTLDGSLHWASVADGTSFSATMEGSLDWSGANGVSASCGF